MSLLLPYPQPGRNTLGKQEIVRGWPSRRCIIEPSVASELKNIGYMNWPEMVAQFFKLCRRQRGFVVALWWTLVFAAMSFLPSHLLHVYRRLVNSGAQPFSLVKKRGVTSVDDGRPANLATLGINLILLSFRGSLLQRNNFCMVSAPPNDKETALSRAARVIVATIQGAHKPNVSQEDFRGQLLDMSQYENSYGARRIATHASYDSLVQQGLSDYFIVSAGGFFYRISTVGSSWSSVQATLECIQEDARSRDNPALMMGMLTALPRRDWYRSRQKLLADSQNQEVLRVLEEALFFVALDDNPELHEHERWRWVRDQNPGNRWFDFAYQMVVLRDGTVGYVVDHVAADGAAASSQIAYWLKESEKVATEPENNSGVLAYSALVWRDPAGVHAAKILAAEQSLQQERAKWFSTGVVLRDLGSSAIKAGAMSPDAGVQLVCQLAFYKTLGRYPRGSVGVAQFRQCYQGRYSFVHSLTRQAMRWIHASATGDLEHGKATAAAAAQSVSACFRGMRHEKDFFATIFAMAPFQVFGSIRGNALASHLNMRLGKYLPGVYDVVSPELLMSNMSSGSDITYIAGVSQRVSGLSMCYKIYPDSIRIEIFWNCQTADHGRRLAEALQESGALLKQFLGSAPPD